MKFLYAGLYLSDNARAVTELKITDLNEILTTNFIHKTPGGFAVT